MNNNNNADRLLFQGGFAQAFPPFDFMTPANLPLFVSCRISALPRGQNLHKPLNSLPCTVIGAGNGKKLPARTILLTSTETNQFMDFNAEPDQKYSPLSDVWKVT